MLNSVWHRSFSSTLVPILQQAGKETTQGNPSSQGTEGRRPKKRRAPSQGTDLTGPLRSIFLTQAGSWCCWSYTVVSRDFAYNLLEAVPGWYFLNLVIGGYKLVCFPYEYYLAYIFGTCFSTSSCMSSCGLSGAPCCRLRAQPFFPLPLCPSFRFPVSTTQAQPELKFTTILWTSPETASSQGGPVETSLKTTPRVEHLTTFGVMVVRSSNGETGECVMACWRIDHDPRRWRVRHSMSVLRTCEH